MAADEATVNDARSSDAAQQEDDVEAHRMTGGVRPEDEDEVEGHQMGRPAKPDSMSTPPSASDEPQRSGDHSI